ASRAGRRSPTSVERSRSGTGGTRVWRSRAGWWVFNTARFFMRFPPWFDHFGRAVVVAGILSPGPDVASMLYGRKSATVLLRSTATMKATSCFGERKRRLAGGDQLHP